MEGSGGDVEVGRKRDRYCRFNNWSAIPDPALTGELKGKKNYVMFS